jgi:aminobenzoyl-glutamate utilization protein A
VISPEIIRQVIDWRRDFHRYPELGFLEYRTAARVAAELTRLGGCTVKVGSEVMQPAMVLDSPSPEAHARARREAVTNGADEYWVERFEEGLTGVVAEWKFARPGPVVAFRFDLDALPIDEPSDAAHVPYRNGFSAKCRDRMHACGHDAHTAMGLGLATVLAQSTDEWSGTVRLIFQPAEEGCRGAKSMVAAGVVDDVDWLICSHLGVATKRVGQVACGTTGMLATTKFAARFSGRAAHAAVEPELGRNALLAAATAALQLHALPRHGAGISRVNAGQLNAGTATNVIASQALLRFEVRGETTDINRFMTEAAQRVVRSAAAMYEVAVEIDVLAEALGVHCDAEMIALVRQAAMATGGVDEIFDTLTDTGSDDATLLMDAVQARGGRATYLLVGTSMSAGHHRNQFDLDEASMALGIELFLNILRRTAQFVSGQTRAESL